MLNEKNKNVEDVSQTIGQKEEEEEKGAEMEKTSLIEKIVFILQQKFKGVSEKELLDIANELAIGLLDAESRKHYALGILHRAKNYVHGYLRDYRIESEIQDKTYPLMLVVKIYF